ncbi:MAG: class I SAM-dependent methyltransferase [Minisyncoccia bacterium]
MNDTNASIKKRFRVVAASRTFRNLREAFDLERRAVFDIGCSYGEFLAHFGPGSAGITIAPEESAYARGCGLDVIVGNIEDPLFTQAVGRRFDAVFANNIFEHLYSPHAFLLGVKTLLTQDGVLILGVPCVPKIVSFMRVQKFRGALASQHINFFTRDTLRLTVESAGWTVEDVRGFRFGSRTANHAINFVYPHFYVIARPDATFAYSEKRQKELRGYRSI